MDDYPTSLFLDEEQLENDQWERQPDDPYDDPFFIDGCNNPDCVIVGDHFSSECCTAKEMEEMTTEHKQDYPIPDPAWDYAQCWQIGNELKTEVERFLETVNGFETATEESNKQLRNRLEWIKGYLYNIERSL